MTDKKEKAMATLTEVTSRLAEMSYEIYKNNDAGMSLTFGAISDIAKLADDIYENRLSYGKTEDKP